MVTQALKSIVNRWPISQIDQFKPGTSRTERFQQSLCRLQFNSHRSPSLASN